ncbi:hypothetical protein AMJ44_07055 [candidate division WOR-1 bacterium DG_54_3]|uniref:Glycosyltransferase RgtA/B/C/D-like domain-containing protein n=1 Tax=candidate division WOR-1 bacterium DG_54_3 TaxID=1703775 RepID=A0A0S7Y021_UNCSA|nr:MAG: hypothetical protein AMJ44_07055 [candidate division WOR-1 bacterium DG_54_3]
MIASITDRIYTNKSKNDTLLLYAALFVIALVYLSTLSVNHSEAEDSLYYLMDISRGSLADQVHPNHILYNLINFLFLNFWKLLGYEGGPELPVKLVNIIGSLFSLLLVYLLATGLRFHIILRYFCVFAIAFSCGFWWYSVECETYILPIVFVLLCLRQLMQIQIEFFRPANHLLLAVFYAIAILFHQQHALLGVPIIISYFLIFYFHRDKITPKVFFSRIILYILVCSLLVLVSYFIVALLVKRLTTYDQIANWAQGWMNKRPIKLGYWSIGSTVLGSIGFLRTFIGGHFLFSFESFSNFLQKNLPSFMLKEEIFLVRDLNLFQSISLSLASLCIVLALIWIIINISKARFLTRSMSCETDSDRLRFFITLLLLYLLTYSLFNIWWEPQNVEHWISIVPASVLVFALFTNRIIHKLEIKVGIIIIAICLFFVNLIGSILPQTKQYNDYWYVFNSWFIENCNAKDVVLSGSGVISDGYVKYYSEAKVISIFPDPDDRPIEKKFQEFLHYQKPERILFSSTVYSPPEEYRQKFDIDYSAANGFFQRSRTYLTLLHCDSWQEIYLYNKDR